VVPLVSVARLALLVNSKDLEASMEPQELEDLDLLVVPLVMVALQEDLQELVDQPAAQLSLVALLALGGLAVSGVLLEGQLVLEDLDTSTELLLLVVQLVLVSQAARVDLQG
jgi:hypothetical protein